MATSTFGTNSTSSIPNGLKYLPGFASGMATADVATMALGIKDDLNPTHPVVPEAFSYNGQLILPRQRGMIRLVPGDWVLVTTRGWPIVLSADEVTSGLWTHNP